MITLPNFFFSYERRFGSFFHFSTQLIFIKLNLLCISFLEQRIKTPVLTYFEADNTMHEALTGAVATLPIARSCTNMYRCLYNPASVYRKCSYLRSSPNYVVFPKIDFNANVNTVHVFFIRKIYIDSIARFTHEYRFVFTRGNLC